MHSFATVMARRRFEAIGKYFHTYNRRAIPQGNTDRLIILRPVMEYIRQKCMSLYIPEQSLSLDEGMMKWKGRLSIKVYNPKKTVKYGLKFYFLCESQTGYVLDFIIYRGVSSSLRDLVFSLLRPYLNQGYHVFMDNYYNSVALAEELYAHGTHCSGTLRLPRGGPSSIRRYVKGRTLKRDDLIWRRKNNTFVICWQDVRLISFVTNGFNAETEPFIHRRRVKRGGRYTVEEFSLHRPKVVGEYINYMGGVDHFDQMMNYYSFARRSSRWTKKTIFYLVQLALVNAFAMYNKYGTDGSRRKKRTLRQFHEEIADALMYFDITEWPDTGSRIPHAAALPLDERADRLPPPEEANPDDPLPMTSDAGPSTSAGAAGTSDAAPSTSAGAAGTSADAPSTSAGPYERPAARHVFDDPLRLVPGNHHLEKIGGPTQQKKCRVCYKSGRRRDTTYQCAQCKVALCVSKRDCFSRYHTLKKYWTSPTRGASVGRRVRRRN